MKILYVHPHFSYPGGAGKFVLETGERIAKKGHDVTILAQNGDECIISNYPHIDFKFIGGPLPNKISHWIQYPLLIKRVLNISKYDFDIIFPQVFPANYWGFILKKYNLKIPCIWYCHEPSAFVYNDEIINGLKQPMQLLAKFSNPIMKIIDKRLVQYANIIVTNSYFTSHNIKSVYGRDSIVIYPGVDTSRFKPCKNKDDYILAVARLTKFKRLDSLIMAMRHIDNANLYIAGDGEDKNRLIALSKKNGLSDRIKFLGKLSDKKLYQYYSKAKVVVVPTYNEPFGLVPLEAMASGTPVIAMASGGPMETIINGKTGFLVNDIPNLIDKVNLVLNDVRLREELSYNARIYIEKQFSWESTSNNLINIFENITGDIYL